MKSEAAVTGQHLAKLCSIVESGADLEGGVGGAKSGGLVTEVPQWGLGAMPQQGAWGRSPPETGAFKKTTQPEIKGQVKMKRLI